MKYLINFSIFVSYFNIINLKLNDMKTHFLLTGLLILSRLLFSQENVFVTTDADNITVCNKNAQRNCGFKNGMQVAKTDVLYSPNIIEPGINETTGKDNKIGLSSYPNPFNKTTTITYDLPDRQFVSLSIFDLSGRNVFALINEMQTKGNHKVIFDASELNKGIYLVNLKSSQFSETKKTVLIK